MAGRQRKAADGAVGPKVAQAGGAALLGMREIARFSRGPREVLRVSEGRTAGRRYLDFRVYEEWGDGLLHPDTFRGIRILGHEIPQLREALRDTDDAGR